LPHEPANGQVADRQSRIDGIVLEFLKAEEAGRQFDCAAALGANPDLAEDLAAFFSDHYHQPAQRELGTAIHVSAGDTDTGGPESPLPEFAGRIKIQGKIAGGGMGDVLRGHDPEIDREVAVKVLLLKHRRSPELVRRFTTEAKINGRLQHPGIAPIYDMGKLEDGSPFFAMKLIQGRTLEEMLSERPTPGHYLPRFLKIFEQISETIAYAHSNGIIHRDLKPRNVMVVAFGEVQVMDWGLAKLRQAAPEAACGVADEPKSFAETPLPNVTSKGTVIGTLAYMPPEQARGEVDSVDERSDVFGLGAILCEILTGLPPHTGPDHDTILARVRRGDMSDAISRLNASDADADLVELAQSCLTAEPANRPHDGQAVATAMIAYQNAVQEKLKTAGAERAAANARAKEAKVRAAAEEQARHLANERAKEAKARAAAETQARLAAEARANAELKRRKATTLMAASILSLLVGLTSFGIWYFRHQAASKIEQANAKAARAIEEANAARPVELAIAEAERRFEEAWKEPAGEVSGFRDAVAAAKNAVILAENSATPQEWRDRASRTLKSMEAQLKAAERDARLLTRAIEVHVPRESRNYVRDEYSGLMIEVAESDADQQFATTFKEWGIDIDRSNPNIISQKILARPKSFGPAVAAILCEWAWERCQKKRPEAECTRLIDLADRVDDDSYRKNLRGLFTRVALPKVGAAEDGTRAAIPSKAGTPPAPATVRDELRALARQPGLSEGNVLNVLLLARTLRAVDDEREAEKFLRAAVLAQPSSILLLTALGRLLLEQRPPRWSEAAECFAAIRALRPEYGWEMTWILQALGRQDEVVALRKQLVLQQPQNPERRYRLSMVLWESRRLDEAVAENKMAINLKPDCAEAYNNLGVALRYQYKFEEAIAALQKALELRPNYPLARRNLTSAEKYKRKLDEAIATHGKAVNFKPDDANKYLDLGIILRKQKDLVGAIAAFGKAARLKRDFVEAHCALSMALSEKNDYFDAELSSRKAIELKPDLPAAHFSLGIALQGLNRLDEAITANQRAIALDPSFAEAHCNLGGMLRAKGQFGDSLASYKRGNDLGIKRQDWSYQSQQWVSEATRLVELDIKFLSVQYGKAKPESAAECLELAEFCFQHKHLYANAFSLYIQAFKASPIKIRDPRNGHLLNAERSAVLAANGQSADAAGLDNKACLDIRQQALIWLQSDVAMLKVLAESDKPADRIFAENNFKHRQQDPNLASVRDPAALAKLPEAEQKSWRQLWDDVAALLKKAEEPAKK
jgi:tetratricopeptide (TPR) repeat protein/tRNA A-37 threonylcarbamoyl transferase component Bud32